LFGKNDITKGQNVHLLDPHGNIVGFGIVHIDDPIGTCHGMTIEQGDILIEVTASHISNYKLPIPNGDVDVMGEDFQGFVIWETIFFQPNDHSSDLNVYVR